MSRQRQRFAQQSTRPAARPILWVLSALLCAVLSACADDDSGRRFANEPLPTDSALSTATTIAVTGPTETPAPPSASPVSVSQLLSSPGGANLIVVKVGDIVVAVAAPWTAPRPIWRGADGKVLALATSPASDQIALLVAPASAKDRIDLVVLAPDSSPQHRVQDLRKLVGASPGDQSAVGQYSLSWSPDSTRVLIGLATGGIVSVPLDGEPQVLIGPARATAPGQVSWSPRGDAIAYIQPASASAAGGLYVAPTGAVPLDPVSVVAPSGDGRRTVSTFAWTPDGEALLYTLASTTGDPLLGGDLFRVPAAGGAPRLIAGASRVAQVAAVTRFALSPDGAGVAYVVTAPDDEGKPSDTLWLQPLSGLETEQLPVGSGEHVTAIWWTIDGLVWETSTSAGDQDVLTLHQAKPGRSPSIVYDGPAVPATPQASPVASPIAVPATGTPSAQ